MFTEEEVESIEWMASLVGERLDPYEALEAYEELKSIIERV